MLVMQLLESLPACTATIKKIHQFIYGSGESLMPVALIMWSGDLFADQNFTAPQAKDYLELLLADSQVTSSWDVPYHLSI